MATTLTVRGVPETLHARLKRQAEKHRRSLNSEVLALLEDALARQTSRTDVLHHIDRLREQGPTIADTPDALKSKMRQGLR